MAESLKRKATHPKKKAKSCQENLRLWKCAFKDNLKLKFNKEDAPKQKKKSRHSFDDHIQLINPLNEKKESQPIIGTVVHEIIPIKCEVKDSKTEEFVSLSVKERILVYEQASNHNIVKLESDKDHSIKGNSAERQSLFEVMNHIIKTEKKTVVDSPDRGTNATVNVNVKGIQERVKNRSDIIAPMAQQSKLQGELQNDLMVEEPLPRNPVHSRNDSTETIAYQESDISETTSNSSQHSVIVLDLSKTGSQYSWNTDASRIGLQNVKQNNSKETLAYTEQTVLNSVDVKIEGLIDTDVQQQIQDRNKSVAIDAISDKMGTEDKQKSDWDLDHKDTRGNIANNKQELNPNVFVPLKNKEEIIEIEDEPPIQDNTSNNNTSSNAHPVKKSELNQYEKQYLIQKYVTPDRGVQEIMSASDGDFKKENGFETGTRKRKCVEEDGDIQRMNKMKKSPHTSRLSGLNEQRSNTTRTACKNSYLAGPPSENATKPTDKPGSETVDRNVDTVAMHKSKSKEKNYKAKRSYIPHLQGRPRGSKVSVGRHSLPCANVEIVVKGTCSETSTVSRTQRVESSQKENRRISYGAPDVILHKVDESDSPVWKNAEIGTAKLVNNNAVRNHQPGTNPQTSSKQDTLQTVKMNTSTVPSQSAFISYNQNMLKNVPPKHQEGFQPNVNHQRSLLNDTDKSKEISQSLTDHQVNACSPIDARTRDSSQHSGTTTAKAHAENLTTAVASYPVSTESMMFRNPLHPYSHQYPAVIHAQNMQYGHSNFTRSSCAYVRPNQVEPLAQFHQGTLHPQNKHFKSNGNPNVASFHQTNYPNVFKEAHQVPPTNPFNAKLPQRPLYNGGPMVHRHMVPSAEHFSEIPRFHAVSQNVYSKFHPKDTDNEGGVSVGPTEAEALLASYRAMNCSQATDGSQSSTGNTARQPVGIEQLQAELQQEKARRMAAEHELWILKMNLRCFVHDTPHQVHKPDF